MYDALTAEVLRQAAIYNLWTEIGDKGYHVPSIAVLYLTDSKILTNAQHEALTLLHMERLERYNDPNINFMLMLFLAEFVHSENILEHEEEQQRIRQQYKEKYAVKQPIAVTAWPFPTNEQMNAAVNAGGTATLL